MVKAFLDATGLLCPLPVLKLRRRLREMAIDEVLTIHTTDPGTVRDIPDFCHSQGHVLLSTGQEGEVLTFTIRKGGRHSGRSVS